MYAISDISKTQLGSTNTYYEYNSTSKTLIITGEGNTPNLSNNSSSIPWFDWRSNGSIDNVIIEEGVTSLGSYFLYNVRANNIVLPNSLLKIGNYALSYTLGMSNWNLPNSLTNISNNAFFGDSTVTNITLPKSLTYIGSKAFYQCSNLTDIIIPENVNTIGTSAFQECNKLSTVKFNSLTTNVNIFSNSFMNCKELKQVEIPLNATLGAKSFGYLDADCKANDFTLYVFNDSNAQVYAQSYGINYSLIDSIKMNDGVEYKSSYDENNLNETYTFIYSTIYDGTYTFISYGDCDLKAKLYDDKNNLIAENDDTSKLNLNFSITEELNKNTDYKLVVSNVKTQGNFTIIGKLLCNGDKVHNFTKTVIPPTLDDDGYTIYKCTVCGFEYKGDFVPKSSFSVTGSCVLMENQQQECKGNIPYTNLYFIVDGRRYDVDKNGAIFFNTFDDCDIVFTNNFGEDKIVHVNVDDKNVDIGNICFEGFDINKDKCVNAKDFYLFTKLIDNDDDAFSFDYNQDGIEDINDWQLAENFFVKK